MDPLKEPRKKIRKLAKSKQEVPSTCATPAPQPEPEIPVEAAAALDESPDERVLLVCGRCNTLMDFRTDKCPLCGAELIAGDTGIVGLVEDLAFAEHVSGEVSCPLCGERAAMSNGVCSRCGEVVLSDDSEGAATKVSPIIDAPNVVYLHLDVESGSIDYFHKASNRRGFEQMKIKLSSEDEATEGGAETASRA